MSPPPGDRGTSSQRPARSDRIWAGVTIGAVLWPVHGPDHSILVARLADLLTSLPDESWVKHRYLDAAARRGATLEELLAAPAEAVVIDLGDCTREEFLEEAGRQVREPDSPHVLRIVRARRGLAVLTDHAMGDAALVMPTVFRLLGIGRGDEGAPPPLGCRSVRTRVVAGVAVRLVTSSGRSIHPMLARVMARARSRLRNRRAPSPVTTTAPFGRPTFVPVQIAPGVLAELDRWRRTQQAQASLSMVLFFAFLRAFVEAGLVSDPVDAHLIVSLRRFAAEMQNSGGNVIGSMSWRVGELDPSAASRRLREATLTGELVLNFLLGRLVALARSARRDQPVTVENGRWAVSWSDIGRLDYAIRGELWAPGSVEERVAGFTIPIPARLVALSATKVGGAAHVVCTFDGSVLDPDLVAKALQRVADDPLPLMPDAEDLP